MQKIAVLSLGGSLIIPDSYDIDFLKKFSSLVESYTKKGFKFIIICGGGRLARNIQEAASKIRNLGNEELDWLGIHATELNAQLVKSLFRENAENFIVSNPKIRVKMAKKVLIASGWIPGWSTDYDAVLLAKNFGVKEVINMSNVDYVYDKDPRKFKNAKKIERIRWADYLKMTGTKWKAGMNVPFDPIAAKEARKSGISVSLIGKDLNNLKNLLDGKKFRGTLIH